MLPRALTALVGIPVLVAAAWWGGLWLAALTAAAALLAGREFCRLAPAGAGPLPAGLGAVWAAAMVVGAYAAGGHDAFLPAAAAIWAIGALPALLWLVALYPGSRPAVAGICLLAAPLYAGFLPAHALLLRELAGAQWLLFALLTTFAVDTGAFFAGRSLGRRPLAPRISPAKTWEGAAGGFLAAVTAASLMGPLFGLGAPWWQTAAIGATVGVASQLGDLMESALKRMSNVKDSGSIIPGHGGILDRMDSLAVSLPAVYYLAVMVVRP